MPEQTLDLAAYLAQLEAQRAALNIQIAGARAALGLTPEPGAEHGVLGLALGGGIKPTGSVSTKVGPPGHVRPDEFFRMSLPEAVQRYLEIMKRPQTPKEIAEGIKAGGILSEAKHFYANVFTALRRLQKQNLVMNTKSGGWGLAAWYAGRSGGNSDEKAKPKKAARRAAKTRTGAPKPKKATKGTNTTPTKERSGYRAFIAEQMKAGKKMAEAAAAWRQQKGTA